MVNLKKILNLMVLILVLSRALLLKVLVLQLGNLVQAKVPATIIHQKENLLRENQELVLIMATQERKVQEEKIRLRLQNLSLPKMFVISTRMELLELWMFLNQRPAK